MKALAWRFWWRVLCLLLVPVQLLTSAAVHSMHWLVRAADDAEVEMLLAQVARRVAAKRRGAGGRP